MKKTMKRMLFLSFVALLVLVTIPAYAFKDYGDIDLGGKTINFVGWSDNLDTAKKNGKLAEAEEKFNCKIVHKNVPWDNYTETLMNRLLTGDSAYDVWRLNHYWFYEFVAKDALLPVTDVYGRAYYDDFPQDTQGLIDLYTYQGDSYLISMLGIGCTRFVCWNKDLFKREGLPDLYELYENDEWTWEKAREIAKKATKDLDGDGKIDQWGWDSLYSWLDLMISNEANMTKEDENGKIRFAFNDEDALEVLREAYRWGTVDKIARLDTWPDVPFKEGKVAMAPFDNWRIPYFKKDMEDDFGIVPLPKGPSAKDYHISNTQSEGFFIPANAENAKALVAVTDFLFRPVCPLKAVEQAKYNFVVSAATDRHAARIIQDMLTNWNGQMIIQSLIPKSVWKAYKDVIKGKKGAAEAMNAVAAEAQAYIDDMFGY